MKTVCIYHSIDLDGWMSAAIVKHWFNQQEVPNKQGEDCNTLDFIGYNYGQPILDLSEYDKVIMCDISFPKEEMEKITHKLVWIDHHKSAIDMMDDHGPYDIDGLRNTKFAACELTWKYFFPNEAMPEIVRLLGLYDSFRHKGTDEETKVLEFQYGARQEIFNYEEAYKWLRICINEEFREQDLLKAGHFIYQYLCTEAKQVYKNGFEVELGVKYYGGIDPIDENSNVQIFTKGFKFICINKERFNPINFGIDYHKDGYDGAACFHYANGMWNFSIYNDNGLVDCSVIAKQYSGGGHKGASGFKLNNEQFLQLLNNK